MKKTTRLKKPQIPELDTLYQFDDLGGRPKYGGKEMTSETDIPSFQEIMDETHSAVVAEATARDDADEELEAQIQELAGQTSEAIETVTEAINTEASTRGAADNVLQEQIDALVASSDVKDIVGTKAELDAYDTSTLGDNDIIKVLQDESQNDATTYYRYVQASDSFTLIGSEGPYYTKAQSDAALNLKADKATTYTKTEVDTALNTKQDELTAGENITIDNNVISAQSGAKTLTTADYNWNSVDRSTSGTLNSFAMWLMPDGLYSFGPSIKVSQIKTDINNYVPGGTLSSTRHPGTMLVLSGNDVNNRTIKTFIGTESHGGNPPGKNAFYVICTRTDGTSAGPSGASTGQFGLTRDDVVDVLTTSDGSLPLSANQGKNLKNMIGDLTNLNTETKTNLVNAINELVNESGAVRLYAEFTRDDADSHIYKDVGWEETYTMSEIVSLFRSGKKVYAAVTAYSPDYEYDTPCALLVGVEEPCPEDYCTTWALHFSAGEFVYIYYGEENSSVFSPVMRNLTNPFIQQTVFGLNSSSVVSQAAIRAALVSSSGDVSLGNTGSTANAGTSSGDNVFIGTGTKGFPRTANVSSSIAIGPEAVLYKSKNSIQLLGEIGASSNGTANGCIAIGTNAQTAGAGNRYGRIALGYCSKANADGEMNIGSTNSTYGYNSSNYRLLTGLYDPQSDHDAATKGYVDTAIAAVGGVDEINAADWSDLWQ